MSIPRTCEVCGRRGIDGTNRCERHPRPPVTEADRLERHPYRRHYQSAEYLRNRPMVLERAGGHCRQCGSPLGLDWTCDHVIPVRIIDLYGPEHFDLTSGDSLANLQALCPSCTVEKNRADQEKWPRGT